METLYTLRQIQEHTHLQMDFIRKVHKANKDVFRPHTRRGDKNSLLFTTGGLTLFDTIKQKKEDGATIPEITAYLRQLSPHDTQTATQTPQNTPTKQEPGTPEDAYREMVQTLRDEHKERIAELKDYYERFLAEREQRLKENEANYTRLLADRRSPEEVKREQEEQAAKIRAAEQEKNRLAEELRQKELEREAAEQKAKEALELERQAATKTAQELKEAREREAAAIAKAERAEKQAELLLELQALPWHAFARRKELQRQIDEIKL